MKKRTKIISLVLALLLVVALVPTALVQAFASDDYYLEYESPSTEDEPSYVPSLTSMKITKEPYNTTIEKDCDGYVWADDLMEGLEMLLTFSDGTTYNYSYDEDFDVPECFYENGIAEKYDYEDISLTIQGAEEDGSLNNLPLGETEITYQLLNCTAKQKITVLENEYVLNPVTKLELTKLPDKEFSAPYVTGDLSEENDSNSIAYNMKGAELTIYRKNGEKEVIAFSEGIYNDYDDDGSAFAPYVYWTDPNAEPILSTVKDLGNYKAVISIPTMTDLKLEFTVNHKGSTTPGEVTKPTNPGSSTDVSIATSDTATKDTVNGNNSNGSVATGDVTFSVILLSVLLAAVSIMAVVGRKKRLF